MPDRANKILIQRYYDEMWNQWKFDLADELLTAEISFRGSLGDEMHGRTAFCSYMRRVRDAFPDFRNEIEEMVTEGDSVVARLSYSGTHRGEIFGLAPTNKRICYGGAAFFSVKNGCVDRGWVLGDLLGLLRQLGARMLP